MQNPTKQKAEAGRRTLGTFFHSGSESIAECLGYAGLDYFIIDTEHAAFDTESALRFVRAGKSAGITPFVRVKDSSRSSILKMLDAGAMGLIIPMVNTVAEVRQIVEYGKYYPLGERGISASAGTQFWTQDWAKHGMQQLFEVANRQTMIVPQCETRGCLDNIEEIVRIDGVDGIFIGPYDLSAALGAPGDFGSSQFSQALQRVVTACADAGKPSFIYAGTPTEAQERFCQGFDSVTYSMDVMVLLNSVRELVTGLGQPASGEITATDANLTAA